MRKFKKILKIFCSIIITFLAAEMFENLSKYSSPHIFGLISFNLRLFRPKSDNLQTFTYNISILCILFRKICAILHIFTLVYAEARVKYISENKWQPTNIYYYFLKSRAFSLFRLCLINLHISESCSFKYLYILVTFIWLESSLFNVNFLSFTLLFQWLTLSTINLQAELNSVSLFSIYLTKFIIKVCYRFLKILTWINKYLNHYPSKSF